MPQVKNEVLSEGWQELPVKWSSLGYWFVRKQYPNVQYLWPDLEEEAQIALVRAARYYDPDYRTKEGKPVKFNTYAVWVLRKQVGQAYNRLSPHWSKGRPLGSTANRRTCTEEMSRFNEDRSALRASIRLDELLSRCCLSASEREAVRLCLVEQLTQAEAAKALGVSPYVLRGWVESAVELMKDCALADREQ